AESQTAIFDVHLDHAQGQGVAFLDNLAWMIHALVGKFRNVDQPFDFGRIDQLGKCTELGQLGNCTLNKLADVVFNRNRIPGISRLCLHAQADALAFRVNADDFHLHRIAYFENFARVGDMLPRQFGEVYQTFGPANIDKSAEIDQADHATCTLFADLQVLNQ